MPDEAHRERAVVLAAVAQEGGADDPGEHRGRDGRRRPESEAPKANPQASRMTAASTTRGPRFPTASGRTGSATEVGGCSDVRGAWGDCH